MKKWVREFRLIPIALVAIGALLVLKTAGILLEGGYSLGQRLNRGETIVVTTVPASNSIQLRSNNQPLDIASAQPAGAARPWMQEVFNYPDITGTVRAPQPNPNDAAIVTGSVAASKPPASTNIPPSVGTRRFVS